MNHSATHASKHLNIRFTTKKSFFKRCTGSVSHMSPVALLSTSLFCSSVDGAPPHPVFMGSKLAKELVILLCLKIMSDITTITPSQWYVIDVLNSDDDHIDMPNLIKMVKLTKNPYYDFNFTYFHLMSFICNFIFCTHCPASNSLASCEQCFCNITGLSINFVIVVVAWSI